MTRAGASGSGARGGARGNEARSRMHPRSRTRPRHSRLDAGAEFSIGDVGEPIAMSAMRIEKGPLGIHSSGDTCSCKRKSSLAQMFGHSAGNVLPLARAARISNLL
jgi:hypothetical protein